MLNEIPPDDYRTGAYGSHFLNCLEAQIRGTARLPHSKHHETIIVEAARRALPITKKEVERRTFKIRRGLECLLMALSVTLSRDG
jgi:hypothetical protein